MGWDKKMSMRSLGVVQKWILKIIYDKNRLFLSDQLFTVTDLWQLYAHKLLMNLHKGVISIENIGHPYATRAHNQKSLVPRSTKTIGQRYCKHYISQIFNCIPKNIKEKINNRNFKMYIRNWIQQIGRERLHNLINNT